MSNDWAARFGEFTEAGYREHLAAARERFLFEPYGTTTTARHVLWRHDVDYSISCARRMAHIEHLAGVRATYFFMITSAFYNVLEPRTAMAAREIAELGHGVGLHFEARGEYSTQALDRAVARDRIVLEQVLSCPIDVVSFHNPGLGLERFMRERVGGLHNVYSASLQEAYEYVSDSNGLWRFTSLGEHLAKAETMRLHVLTHPVWWPPEPLPPRLRVERVLAERSTEAMTAYDELLDRAQRPNVRE